MIKFFTKWMWAAACLGAVVDVVHCYRGAPPLWRDVFASDIAWLALALAISGLQSGE